MQWLLSQRTSGRRAWLTGVRRKRNKRTSSRVCSLSLLLFCRNLPRVFMQIIGFGGLHIWRPHNLGIFLPPPSVSVSCILFIRKFGAFLYTPPPSLQTSYMEALNAAAFIPGQKQKNWMVVVSVFSQNFYLNCYLIQFLTSNSSLECFIHLLFSQTVSLRIWPNRDDVGLMKCLKNFAFLGYFMATRSSTGGSKKLLHSKLKII